MNKILSFICVLFLFASCGTTSKLTKQEAYAKLYEERPLTIAVMPPINNTNNVEAKEFLYYTLSQPLCEKGYYVIPTFLTMEMYQSESAYDSEQFIDGSVKRFNEVLGADAVLFTRIDKWEKAALASNIYVNIEYILKSAHTNEILFRRKGNITYDASVGGGGGGIFGALIELTASAISTAATDHIRVGRACNNFTLSDMPAGTYNPNFDQDQTLKAGLEEFSQKVK